ncbi:MAG TPA: ABC transporter ATP-binding protein [Thermoanaerobaculia bacterium]|nr:ABC transporter ATP-binding protein [Thermoanaerobaculia bacterium]
MLKRLSYLWPYLARHRRKLLLGMAAIVCSVAVGLLNPLLLGRAVDQLRHQLTSGALAGYAGLIVGVSLVQGIFSYAQRMVLVGMSRDIEYDLRNDYFSRLERQAPLYFHDHPTGDLMARATNDLQAVRMLCGPAIMYSFNTLVAGAGALFFMLRIHAGLALLALVTMPLVALATKFFGERIHVLFERVQESFADVTARVQENLAGVRVVRAYAQEEVEEARFRRINQQYVDGNRRLIGWSVSFHPLLQTLIGLASAAVLWYGGSLVIGGAITVGQFVTFNFFLGRLAWPMIALGWVINLAQRGAASLGRIREVLEAEPAIRDEEPLFDPGTIRGEVRASRLDFSYRAGQPPVLEQIDLRVAAGQTVAVVGRTGAGKSTLLALIPRLLDPPPGSLEVDGIDVRRLPLARLRSAIAMVPQETFLFSATIRENIALGAPAAISLGAPPALGPAARPTDEAIAAAARLAGLEPDLAAFPHGLDTLVGERGLTLSGGQKQRVALARALLRQPQILLLDDCLSAVDTQTEETILRNLRSVAGGRTVFLVSHRVSTVKDADLILVLEGGRVEERGTHAQLLARGGLYADLYHRQLLEEELAAV